MSGQYQVTNEFEILIPVPAGSIVLIQLARDAGDTYAGNVAIMRVEFSLN